MNDIVASVVIPTYGRPRQLLDCLEALASQTLTDSWEVVVVDDGSDVPVEVDAMVFGDGMPIRVIRQENAGPAVARNRGVQAARGEFIAFTDDDCRPEPEWLATLVQAARQRPHALIGGTTFNGLTEQIFASTSQMVIDLVYEHFNANPDDAYFVTSNNMLCARGSYLTLQGFDASFSRAGAEDRDFCDRWRAAGWPIVWRPCARVEHRHSQTLRKFLDLHFRYGRGAYIYQAKRRDRGSGDMRDDMNFHRSLLHRVGRWSFTRGDLRRKVGIASGLVLWQLANAGGFAAEAICRLRGKYPS
jgi:glycosyltransferase involved in cell wall biosynthesis